MPDEADIDDDIVAARARDRIGRVLLGKYRLDRVLGSGGMATVYAATHRNGKEVALKLLHPELMLRAEVRTRFLREGCVANRVKHSGAVSVIDDDVTADGWAFLVMELLEGVTVQELWEQRDFRLHDGIVTAIVLRLLDVLIQAHANGVIHRDLKPANVFLTKDGELKVLDFGIARMRDVAGFRTTNVGTVLGTPAFMAPEQAMAKSAEVDERTDLWSVGGLAYALLVGDVVHPSDNPQQTLIDAATQPAQLLTTLVPTAPKAIVEIFDRALAFDKHDRWPSATAMRDALSDAARAVYGELPGRDVVQKAVLRPSGSSPRNLILVHTRDTMDLPKKPATLAAPESTRVPEPLTPPAVPEPAPPGAVPQPVYLPVEPVPISPPAEPDPIAPPGPEQLRATAESASDSLSATESASDTESVSASESESVPASDPSLDVTSGTTLRGLAAQPRLPPRLTPTTYVKSVDVADPPIAIDPFLIGWSVSTSRFRSVAMLVGGGLATFLLLSRLIATPSASAASPARPAIASVSADPAPTSPTETPMVAATDSSETSTPDKTTNDAPATAKPVVVPTTSIATRTAAASAASSHRHASAHPDCAMPYVVQPKTGRKVWKVECL